MFHPGRLWSGGNPGRFPQHHNPPENGPPLAAGPHHDHRGGFLPPHPPHPEHLQRPVAGDLHGDGGQMLHQLLERRHARLHGRALPHDDQEHRSWGQQRLRGRSTHAGPIPLGDGKSSKLLHRMGCLWCWFFSRRCILPCRWR